LQKNHEIPLFLGCCTFAAAEAYWTNVAKFRRKCQNIPKTQLVFMDQSCIQFGAIPLRGLAPPKIRPAVAHAACFYPPRFDFMGAISYNGPLSCKVLSPNERRRLAVKGWQKHMVLDFMRDMLAKDLAKMDPLPITVVIDKLLKITWDDVMTALHNGGCQNAARVLVIPTAGGKHVSPLDNCLWAEWKRRVRTSKFVTHDGMSKRMRTAFEAITTTQIRGWYKHCALTKRQDPEGARSNSR
jgi:hypothetical protein